VAIQLHDSSKTNKLIERIFKPPSTEDKSQADNISKLVRYNISMIEILKSISLWNKISYYFLIYTNVMLMVGASGLQLIATSGDDNSILEP